MSIKMKMLLVVALVLNSSSMSLAQSGVQKKPHRTAATHSRSRDVALQTRPVTRGDDAWMRRARQMSGF